MLFELSFRIYLLQILLKKINHYTLFIKFFKSYDLELKGSNISISLSTHTHTSKLTNKNDPIPFSKVSSTLL